MGMILALLAAGADPLAMRNGMEAIPVLRKTLGHTDMPVPVSNSVRASTWDEMAIRPSAPVHVHVACIVTTKFGVAGSCVPAASVASGAKTIDWPKARDDGDRWARTADPAEVALLRAVTERLQSARAPEQPAQKSMFVIRFFDEVVSPTDARHPFIARQSLTMRDITLARPMDAGLLARLYPVLALRNAATARVSMACDILEDLTLLCRDPGAITLAATEGTDTTGMAQAFRFATYQFAATLRLMPKDISGDPVAGRQLTLAVSWQLPQ